MNDFMKLVEERQSCRCYDPALRPSREQLENCIRAAQLAPSACNGQPWHLTVCRGEKAKEAAKA